MSVSREARSGDSPEILRARPGTFTLEISRLTSLTRRVFSATSCIRRSRSLDACDRLSMRACTSGDGPCLQADATSNARGTHAPRARRRLVRIMFQTSSTRHGSFGLMRECYTGRLGTVRRGVGACSINYYRPPSWGTTMDITEAWATRAVDPPAYLLSRWLFLRLLGAVYLIAFVSLAVQVSGLV